MYKSTFKNIQFVNKVDLEVGTSTNNTKICTNFPHSKISYPTFPYDDHIPCEHQFVTLVSFFGGDL